MSVLLHASVDIDASSAMVWAILTDFPAYRRWNPFLRAILGKARVGNRLSVTLQRQGHEPLSATSILTLLREPREMRWRQVRFLPFLFASEHKFSIEPRGGGNVRFHQSERVTGLLATRMSAGRQRSTEESFRLMNYALKARAERFAGRLAALDGGLPA